MTKNHQNRIFLGFVAKIWKSAYFQQNSVHWKPKLVERKQDYLL